jgi:hypothetical protein
MPCRKEKTMLYKTIAMQLLESSPSYQHLCQHHLALPTMERLAQELAVSHEIHKTALTKARPGSSPSQISSEAMELALADLEASLTALLPLNPATAPETAEVPSPPA